MRWIKRQAIQIVFALLLGPWRRKRHVSANTAELFCWRRTRRKRKERKEEVEEEVRGTGRSMKRKLKI